MLLFSGIALALEWDYSSLSTDGKTAKLWFGGNLDHSSHLNSCSTSSDIYATTDSRPSTVTHFGGLSTAFL